MKGFIFTLDALLALGIIIIASGIFLMGYSVIEEKTSVFDYYKEKASDDVITYFYSGNDLDSIASVYDSSFKGCSMEYYYKPNNDDSSFNSKNLTLKEYCLGGT
ncbi:MAG: hypothetical protein ABH821_04315 [archaeon]